VGLTRDSFCMRALALFRLFFLSSLPAWADPAPAYWPLAKGTFWIYEGDVSWVERNPATGQNEVRKKHLAWRSEVTDAIDVNGITVALLHGFPLDLAWYDSKTQPSDTLLVKVGPDFYRVQKDALAIFARIKAAQAYVPPQGADAPGETAEMLLDGPLAPGKKFGIASDSLFGLFNNHYCDLVDGPAPFDLRTIRGAPRLDHPAAYSITWQSNPDNEEIDFVPGLGITAYSYDHHGTTMTVDLALKEFGRAKNTPGR
jgi:hypothetical protein